jgi:hypothetical protein
MGWCNDRHLKATWKGNAMNRQTLLDWLGKLEPIANNTSESPREDAYAVVAHINSLLKGAEVPTPVQEPVGLVHIRGSIERALAFCEAWPNYGGKESADTLYLLWVQHSVRFENSDNARVA